LRKIDWFLIPAMIVGMSNINYFSIFIAIANWMDE
jgi:hypothetical protein